MKSMVRRLRPTGAVVADHTAARAARMEERQTALANSDESPEATPEVSEEVPTIEQVLACPKIPSLPVVAIEVLELTRNRDVRLKAIARVVQNDQALTAKILKTVNSSFYALSKPCPTISRALGYLGLSTVKSLVLGFSLVDVTRTSGSGFDLTAYWRRCLTAAAASRRLAAIGICCDPEEAFIAALMQDVGMYAMYIAAPRRYEAVLAETGADHRRLPGVEVKHFGFRHTEVGVQLGERWRLPAEIVDAMQHHHDPESRPDRSIIRVVSLAFEIANALELACSQPSLDRVSRLAHQWFLMDSSEVKALLVSVREDAGALGRLFNVRTGKLPDVNTLLAEAEEAAVEHQLEVQREREDLLRHNDELARRATTDGLTGVGNRQKLDADLAERFEQARTFNGCLGVVIVDADRFKRLNDTFGHQVGDAVLVELARRIERAARAEDIVCRYGGEEFALIMPGATLRDVAEIAEAVREEVAARPFDVSDAPGDVTEVAVTVSAGASAFDRITSDVLTTPALLVKAADQALYHAKQSGRNCVRVFRVPGRAAA